MVRSLFEVDGSSKSMSCSSSGVGHGGGGVVVAVVGGTVGVAVNGIGLFSLGNGGLVVVVGDVMVGDMIACWSFLVGSGGLTGVSMTDKTLAAKINRGSKSGSVQASRDSTRCFQTVKSGEFCCDGRFLLVPFY